METVSRRGLLTFSGARPAPPAAWLRIHRTAMACRFEVTLDPCDRHLLPEARAALAEADRVESLLTIFRGSSEVSRINREAHAGAHGIDREVWRLLRLCQMLSLHTDGAFDVTSGPLSRCWGFTNRQPRVPPQDQIDQARNAIGMPAVRFVDDTRTLFFDRPGMEINLGAIGKGYALDCMATALVRAGVTRALLSAGRSSVRAIGAGGFPIDITSPRIARPRIARVKITDGALGTSGAGQQFVVVDGQRYGHVIDPRSGWPATGVVSASVVASDAATADALSTAFLVGGTAVAADYCERHPGTLALLTLDEDATRTLICGRRERVSLEE